jgi:hypothetical protein
MSKLGSFLRGVVAAILGAFLGGLVNMGLIVVGAKLLPPPAGVDVNDVASIDAHIGEYSVAQLLSPFLAHALGTLIGAFAASLVAGSQRARLRAALVVGVLFQVGGIMAVSMIPSAPLWFDALDLVVAYLPMALLGHRLALRLRGA